MGFVQLMEKVALFQRGKILSRVHQFYEVEKRQFENEM